MAARRVLLPLALVLASWGSIAPARTRSLALVGGTIYIDLPWSEPVLDEMTAARVTLIPTLKLWRYELRHDRASVRDRFAGVGVGQLRAWRGRHGAVIFGTDVGYMDDYDPTDEYVLMAEAGMSSSDILASLTTAPAERFGASSRAGRVATGLQGDLVVLAADPATDVRAFAAVRYTVREGRVIYSAARPK